MYGVRIGAVRQDDFGRRSFEYTDEYAANATNPPLSLSMPVGAGRATAKAIDPYMWGLLPDSAAVRDRWGASFGVSAENPFALLAHMGRDCAGAAQFLPKGVGEVETSEVVLDDGAMRDRLRLLRIESSDWAVPGERWSLAGAQGKFAITVRGDGLRTEVDGDAPSTHIVKPGISEYRQQALVEHLSMTAARAVGLRAARTEYREFLGEPALLVTRFDRRRAPDESVVRVHQEDMCQALAVYPHRKYEANGGPSAADIARVLRWHASDAEADVWQFAQALVFNYLIGAPDAHAKNYAVMLAPGSVRLAPLYDVASALPYDAVGDSEIMQAAMSIGGRHRFGTVHGRHWDRLAAQIKVDAGRLRDEVTRQALEIPGAFDAALEGFDEPELRVRLLPRVENLCDVTVNQLRD